MLDLTIYWERCSVCGRYEPTRQCTMHNELMVCPHCCISCPLRSICPRPVWKLEIRVEKPVVAKTGIREDIKKKLMDELFSKLESGKK
ncbi:MAG: hypothetical protein ABWW65_07425 [Thermoprotei archaeon]